jgi:hypothetical protein
MKKRWPQPGTGTEREPEVAEVAEAAEDGISRVTVWG